MLWIRRKEPDFTMLGDLIRNEIERAIVPLHVEMTNMREAIDRVEKAQAGMYNREVVDLKFQERDSQIREHQDRLDTLTKALGGLWQQTFIKVGVALAVILQSLQLLGYLHR